MIDTDKYEGHTEGPWKHFYSVAGEACEIISEKNGVVGRWENKSDGRLMADAPLLLAEVKRLQDALKEAVEVVKEMESMAYADADADKFANHALEFIGNVK